MEAAVIFERSRRTEPRRTKETDHDRAYHAYGRNGPNAKIGSIRAKVYIPNNCPVPYHNGWRMGQKAFRSRCTSQTTASIISELLADGPNTKRVFRPKCTSQTTAQCHITMDDGQTKCKNGIFRTKCTSQTNAQCPATDSPQPLPC